MSKLSRDEDEHAQRNGLSRPSPPHYRSNGPSQHNGMPGDSSPGLISPPESRRTSSEEHHHPVLHPEPSPPVSYNAQQQPGQSLAQPPRQSLPSIHEALNQEPSPFHYNHRPPHPSTPTAPMTSSSYFPPSQSTPTAPAEIPRREVHHFGQAPPPAASQQHGRPLAPLQPTTSQQHGLALAPLHPRSNSVPGANPANGAPMFPAQGSRAPPPLSLGPGSRPSSSASRPNPPYPPPQQALAPYEFSSQSAPPNGAFTFSEYQSQHPYPSPTSGAPGYRSPPAPGFHSPQAVNSTPRRYHSPPAVNTAPGYHSPPAPGFHPPAEVRSPPQAGIPEPPPQYPSITAPAPSYSSITAPAPSYPTITAPAPQYPSSAGWSSDAGGKRELRPIKAYDVSVKRKLDQFDLESSLWEVIIYIKSESSLLNFC
jgi:hypothetical protein